MTDLDESDRNALMKAVFIVESAIKIFYNPDKINLASLGNLTPHVHWHVIPRFYDAISGDIEIDNQSIYNCTISSLRKNISLVSQDTTLFDDTIRNNIAYANLDASQKEIEEAAKYSFASEFIEKLPNKYETIIGENGTRLSGGEKQRLSIARAMLKKSQIILLDEATSSLDSETESKIQDALKILTKDRTTIVTVSYTHLTLPTSDLV